jgi:hypothetical protein
MPLFIICFTISNARQLGIEIKDMGLWLLTGMHGTVQIGEDDW